MNKYSIVTLISEVVLGCYKISMANSLTILLRSEILLHLLTFFLKENKPVPISV